MGRARISNVFPVGYKFNNYTVIDTMTTDDGRHMRHIQCKCGETYWVSTQNVRDRGAKPANACRKCMKFSDRKPITRAAKAKPTEPPVPLIGKLWIAGQAI